MRGTFSCFGRDQNPHITEIHNLLLPSSIAVAHLRYQTKLPGLLSKPHTHVSDLHLTWLAPLLPNHNIGLTSNMEKTDAQVEAGGGPQSVPHWRLVREQGLVTPEVLHWKYEGSGTEEDPYVVVWIENDPRNPMLFSCE